MFLPAAFEEVERLGWDALDVILVTGDSYIDSPFIGVAVIGVIAQPDPKMVLDIGRLGVRLCSGARRDCHGAGRLSTRAE